MGHLTAAGFGPHANGTAPEVSEVPGTIVLTNYLNRRTHYADPRKAGITRNQRSFMACQSAGEGLIDAAFSTITVGVVAEYNTRERNTLRRSLDGFEHPGHQRKSGGRFFNAKGCQMTKRSKGSKWLMIAGIVGALALLGAALDDKGPTTNADLEPQETAAVKEPAPADPLDSMKVYEGFMATEEAYFKTNRGADADLYKIHTMLNLFSSMAEEIGRAYEKKAQLSDADLAYVKKIEQRLSGLQQRTLPALRLAFRKQAGSVLWEQDISVSVSGGGNTTIVFVGSLFAANANIQQVQDQLQDKLAQLRFKRTRYQWYRGSEGWSYQLDTPPDSAIRMYKFHQFTAPTK